MMAANLPGGVQLAGAIIGTRASWRIVEVPSRGSARARRGSAAMVATNYSVGVDRCQQLAHYYEVAGYVDRHNRHRQHMLKFHKMWKTKKWQRRMMLEIIGVSLVDTHLAC
jgi:hypothetical protein